MTLRNVCLIMSCKYIIPYKHASPTTMRTLPLYVSEDPVRPVDLPTQQMFVLHKQTCCMNIFTLYISPMTSFYPI